MKFCHDHCVGFFHSESSAKQLQIKLEKQGFHPFQDKIPYGAWNDLRYPVFISGKEIFTAKELLGTIPIQDNKSKGE